MAGLVPADPGPTERAMSEPIELTYPDGAVREVIEMILKASDRWQSLMERYLA